MNISIKKVQNELNVCIILMAGSLVGKPGMVASHSLPPQPSRPISTATAAPVKKPLVVKASDPVVDPIAMTPTTSVNTLSKPGVPSVTPIQIRAPTQNLPKLQTQQPQSSVQPPVVAQTQIQPQVQPQAIGKQSELPDPVAILPQTLEVSINYIFALPCLIIFYFDLFLFKGFGVAFRYGCDRLSIYDSCNQFHD